MSDVRLTATNPEDSSVVPVACNSRGELLVAEPVIEEIPNDVSFTNDVSIAGKLTVGGDSSFKASTFDGAVTFSQDVVVNSLALGRGGGGLVSNTAFGQENLQANTTGESNTAIGQTALRKNTEGASNTAVGKSALRETTTGSSNTAVGQGALRDNTTGENNTALGVSSLQSNQTGASNIAIGRESLQLNSSGSSNTAMGQGALRFNTTGENNTAIGQAAIRQNSEGANNIAIGFQSGYLLTGSSNTFIGSHQGAGFLNNTLSLSTGSTERMRIGSDDAVDFNQKCGFTPDGGLWITDERGNKMRTTFTSNGYMTWEAYEVVARNEPQLSKEEIEKERTRNEYGY